MRLSEKLDEVLGLCDEAASMMPSVSGDAAIKRAETAATDFVIEFRDELRKTLRDSERYRWLRDPVNEDAVSSMISIFNYGDEANLIYGAELDAAIDAAMGRREGDG